MQSLRLWRTCPRCVYFSTHSRWVPPKRPAAPEPEPAEVKLPTLKQTLRKLFLKVHPDLFNQHPTERQANEQSFALLTSLVDMLKLHHIAAKPSRAAIPSASFELVFYLRPDTTASTSTTTTADSAKAQAPEEFRKISVQFPSLEAREDPRVLNIIREGLGKLFALSNLESKFVLREREGAGRRQQQQRVHEFSVNSFINGLDVAPKAPSSMLSHVLMLEYRLQGLKFLFEGCGDTEDDRVKILNQFKVVLETINWRSAHDFMSEIQSGAGISLQGPTEAERQEWEAKQLFRDSTPEANDEFPFTKTVTVFSTKEASNVDIRGRLILAARDDPVDWVAFLKTNVMEQVEARQSVANNIKARQSAIAEELGVYDLFCELSLLTDPAYPAFLSRLQSGKQLFKELGDQRHTVAKLSLRVHKKSTFSVDPVLGVIHVPVESDARNVVDFLSIRGGEARQISEEYATRAEDFKEATLKAKRRLQLKGLQQDPGISYEEMLQACQNLATCPPDCFIGLSLRISNQYALPDAEGFITIPFDFYYDGARPTRPRA